MVTGQSTPQAGLVRGVLIANEPGDFVVQPVPGLQYHYRADGKTWIEREEERVRVSDLRPGEILEVVSDRDSQPVRYARLVHVIPKSRPRAPIPAASLNPERNTDWSESIFTGIVSNRGDRRLILRTRFDGEIALLLRDDTHLVSGGREVEPQELTTNLHVFIRAARNRTNDLEAFEIIWGGILQPSSAYTNPH